jgi:hypothetical protein
MKEGKMERRKRERERKKKKLKKWTAIIPIFQSGNGQENWTDTFQRKKYKWQINTWKSVKYP